jgi:hypothetical protein
VEVSVRSSSAGAGLGRPIISAGELEISVASTAPTGRGVPEAAGLGFGVFTRDE